MPATKAPDDQDLGEQATALGLVDVREEDAFWQRAYRRERYHSPSLEYEDYAPAYCVGYIGQAQYGGRFEDAERSLCANWERIKGDSRLSLNDALLAMRAAWERMAAGKPAMPALPSWFAGLVRRRFAMPSFKLSTRLLR